MRNSVIRKKRLRAVRAVDDFMRMPQRIMVPNIRDVNLEAFATGRLWAIPG
jgi:hypothetical protein